MPASNNQLASEDLHAALRNARGPTGKFSALFWNRALCMPSWDEKLGSSYRSELKTATRKAGRQVFRQFEQAESLDSPWSAMSLQALRWRLDVTSGMKTETLPELAEKFRIMAEIQQAIADKVAQ